MGKIFKQEVDKSRCVGSKLIKHTELGRKDSIKGRIDQTSQVGDGQYFRETLK